MIRTLFSAALTALVLTGCPSGPSAEDKAEASRKAAEEAANKAEKEATEAAEKEAKEKAEKEEAEKKAKEEAEAKAKEEAEALSNCCVALGKFGFEKRSVEAAKAGRACEAAVAEGKTFEEGLPVIKEALEDVELPSACSK